MKKQNFLREFKGLLAVALHYYRQHKASIRAIELVYTRLWLDDTVENWQTAVHMTFSFCGSLSNGHLMEIGGYRYCIFDPIQRQLYLESYDEQDCEKKAEIYTAI